MHHHTVQNNWTLTESPAGGFGGDGGGFCSSVSLTVHLFWFRSYLVL